MIFQNLCYFLFRKIPLSRKNPLTEPRGAKFEAEVFDLLRTGRLAVGPVHFEPEPVSHGDADGILKASVDGSNKSWRFIYESKANWTRRSRVQACERLRRTGGELLPLLIGPYWSEADLGEIRELGASAIDVCGNGLLFDPPRLFVLRTGAKKKKRLAPTPRLAVYTSSNIATLVPRVFLCQREFPSTRAVLEACHSRMMRVEGTRRLPLALSTVSKALKELDSDLITERRGRRRCLRDGNLLIEYLRRDFRLPTGSLAEFKTRLPPEVVWGRLSELRPEERYVVTGRGSAGRYTDLAGPGRIQLYVSNLPRFADALKAKRTRTFPNLEICETEEEAPFFDAQEERGVPWASPLQSYLELSRLESDPRERGVAADLRERWRS